MKFLQLLLKRPDDKTIRLLKIIFGLLLGGISVGVYLQGIGFQESIFGNKITQEFVYILWALVGFLSIFPILSGIIDKSLLSKGRTRILQIVYGVTIIIFANLLHDNPKIGFEILYPLLGISAIIAGISGKIITKQGIKAQQKITKIRV